MKNITKSTDTIRKELFSHIDEIQEEYIQKGWLPRRMNINNGVIRGLLEIFIWGLYQLYQFLAFVLTQATPKTASGEWLDMHASGVDLERKKATKTIGNIIFTRLDGANGNIKIPAGKIVRTPVDSSGRQYRFVTQAEAIMHADNDICTVSVISEDYGSNSNVTAGLIREIITPIQGIASVTNNADWLLQEGADTETDSQLLQRYILQWRAQAGVTAASYAFAALSVAGVQDVKIFDQHPRGQGTVDIVVLGTSGEPTDQLIAEVEKAVASAIVINDDVLVKKVSSVAVAIAITVEYYSGSEATLKAAVETGIREQILSGAGKTIGADFIQAKVISSVINLSGIKRIVWNNPSADIEIASDEIVSIESIEITMQQVNDE